MKKVAVLRCLEAERVCAGASCFAAFNERKAHFSGYGDEELQMTAFFACNGCKEIAMNDEAGLQEKLERVVQIGTEVVHVGICTQIRAADGSRKVCPVIEEMVQYLREHGIEIVWGTHG